MKTTRSPVLKSVRRSIIEQASSNEDSDFNINSSWFNDASPPTSKSSGVTQQSILTTQNSQPFKARLEKKAFETSQLSESRSADDEDLKSDITLESHSLSYVDLGPFFGLPSKVQDLIYKNRRIKSLYEWQEKCISTGVLGRNLLISLPTSSGKTLVAEILMLRKLLLYKKDAIFVLPYIALVQEKVRGLCSLALELNFVVEEYAASKGVYPPKKRKNRNTIYVATIEKANSLFESLMENSRISELGIVVVDEVHMISENGSRGAKLEALITKLKHYSSNVQLVSMSATIGNLEVLAKYLNATLFEQRFRPVPLKQYLKVESEVAVVNSKAACEESLLERCSQKSDYFASNVSKLDPDGLNQLVQEVIPERSCLVFCRSRVNAEAVAKLICSFLPKSLLNLHSKDKIALLSALKEEAGGSLCPVLRKTVPFGVVYHHSGLTDGERKLLEEAFIFGSVYCIVCTSTLAAGINLPARRVIIRAPYVGRDFLTKSRYDQMIGRAGRAGLDDVGESIVISEPKDLAAIKQLLMSPTENCYSKLAENQSKGLGELIFSMIGLSLVTSVESAHDLSRDTLLALQANDLQVDLVQEVDQVLVRLRELGLLRSRQSDLKRKLSEEKENLVDPDGKFGPNDELIICRIGRAAVKGSIDLSVSNRLYDDLLKARRSLAVHSHLHLLYLIIPYDVSDQFNCEPQVFDSLFSDLNEEELEVACLLGITIARAVQICRGLSPKGLDKLVLQRFYVALLLHKLLGGMDIWEVSLKFNIHRGLIQQLFNSTVAFAHGVLYFCEELQELWAFKDLLTSFKNTLSLCSYTEVNDLLNLPAVKMGRAKLLFRAGFRSLTDIAKATPDQISSKVDHLKPSIAGQIINYAKMLLIERANSLQDEAEEMLLSLNSN